MFLLKTKLCQANQSIQRYPKNNLNQKLNRIQIHLNLKSSLKINFEFLDCVSLTPVHCSQTKGILSHCMIG